jgi:hypothetical protein
MKNFLNTRELSRGNGLVKSLLIALVLTASVTLSRANITNAWIYEVGDGNMACTYSWSAGNPLGLVGTQYNPVSAGLYGYVATDTPTDPALVLTDSINNDTGVTWTDYHVQISMAPQFTFSSETVSNAGWTISVNQPTLVSGQYVGSINYVAGTTVAPGGELSFGFTLNFVGGINFNEQLTPSFVPEPSAIGLISCGLALLLFRRRFVTL